MERAKENQINNIPDKAWQKIAEKIFYATSCGQNIDLLYNRTSKKFGIFCHV